MWLSTSLSVVFPAECEVLLCHPVSVSGSIRRILFIQMDWMRDHMFLSSQSREDLLATLTHSLSSRHKENFTTVTEAAGKFQYDKLNKD